MERVLARAPMSEITSALGMSLTAKLMIKRRADAAPA
jgi:hypothetical protein